MFIVDEISVRYDQKVTLQNFSFSVEEGEVLSIIVPNGSGKSTLLKAIAGFTSYYEGVVVLDGENIRAIKSKKSHKKCVC